ncbi:penicillin-binding protein 2 [Paraburkholderia sp. SIMBA_049]
MSFTMGFVALAIRALWVQCINDDFYQHQGALRQIREFVIHAERGRLLDREGHPLAVSLPTRAVWMDASAEPQVSRKNVLALAALLGITPERIASISGEHRSFAYLSREVPIRIAQQVITLDIPGVYSQPDYRRYYPEANAAAHVTGFSSVDGIGQEGMEKVGDHLLAGVDGSRRVLRNAHGQAIETLAVKHPRPGKDIRLSIDEPIQYATFKAVKAAVDRTGAKAGSAIVLDAHTGEILALANWPTFDPNRRRGRVGAQVRNRALTDVFEPGSVLKPLTIALALQRGIVTPRSVVSTGGGRLLLDHAVIHDDKDFGTLTVSQVIQKSSNVGTTKIALLLSPQDMWGNFRAVGLGRAPVTGLPGAARGTLRPYRQWRRIEQATMSYGYGLSASLLQLAQVYTTFANDGVYVPASIYAKRGEPVYGRQVYTPVVARQVRSMLQTVVSDDGTAPQAEVPGYTVAGKTGTAYQWTAHGYDHHKYRASFVGIVPAQAPRVIVAVSIDQPRIGSHFGGAVSGPAFADIATLVMRILNVMPDKPGPNYVAEGGEPDA